MKWLKTFRREVVWTPLSIYKTNNIPLRILGKNPLNVQNILQLNIQCTKRSAQKERSVVIGMVFFPDKQPWKKFGASCGYAELKETTVARP